MKKLIVFCLLLFTVVIYASVKYSEVNIRAPFVFQYSNRVVDWNIADDVNDTTLTLNWITGYVEGITIKPTGTDTDFAVDVNDENGANIFSKSSLNSANGVVRYAISHSDTGSTEFVGVPVNGQCKIYIKDANGLTNLELFLYYIECRRE